MNTLASLMSDVSHLLPEVGTSHVAAIAVVVGAERTLHVVAHNAHKVAPRVGAALRAAVTCSKGKVRRHWAIGATLASASAVSALWPSLALAASAAGLAANIVWLAE